LIPQKSLRMSYIFLIILILRVSFTTPPFFCYPFLILQPPVNKVQQSND
jgi:hypothetical protein